MATHTRVDPVTFELIKNGLSLLCDEMAVTMARAAYSTTIRESHDYTTALLTPEGEVMAQGHTAPLHLGSIMYALEGIRNKFGEDIHPGDVFANNDPYEGGSHLPDLFILKPVFVDGKIAAYVGAEAHLSDVGGRVPGSNAADSTEIYQEGLQIPPSHLSIRGKPNRTLWDIIEKNVRQPERVVGDIRALLAAIAVGERGFLKYVRKYGHEQLHFYIAEIMDYTERMVRAEISRWPDGEWSFEDLIDDDGLDPDPIPIRATVRVKGDEVEMDFTGTGRQVRAAINNPFTFTKAACFMIVRAAMGMPLPHNSGFARPVRVFAPEGTILNPRHPAAVASRALPAHRTLNVLLGAIAQIVPDRMMAGDEGGNALITFAGKDSEDRPWLLTDSMRGTWGARQDRDGVDAMSGMASPIANQPCEALELEFPLRMVRYGYVQDSCGAGKFRGGLGLVRDRQFLVDNTMVQVRSDRAKYPPYGLFGGKAGTTTVNVVNPGPSRRELPSKFMIWLNAGDVYRCQLPGAGGWGDPLDRDPALVQRDVRDEKISIAYAAREHGVVVDPETGIVDQAATDRLRCEVRAAAAHHGDG
ncbi:MAG: hydantoinase B/oxoprolinase family protein [Chloroflexi bacterium]|nr:hydantoinase B/oxoprolinase family protein [Chloroflexota bacterium]